VTAEWRDLRRESSAHPRALAVVERAAILPLPHQGLYWLPRGDVTRTNDDFKGHGRLRTAMREVVALLIATSGVLAVVVIVLVVTMLLRALRALCRR